MRPSDSEPARTVTRRRALGRRVARAGGTFALVALVVAGTLGAIAGIHASSAADAAAEEDAAAPRALEVSTAPVVWAESHRVERRFTGLVASRRSLEASFQIAGMVEAVLVDRDDAVAAGQALARLDDRRLRASRAELAANLAEAGASVALARIEADRAQSLVARGASAQALLDEASAALQRAEAQAAALAARIEAVEADLADATLRAPFDATVVARRAEAGAMLQAGAPVLHLLEAGGLEAQVGVPAAVAARLSPGAAASVETRAGRLPATVRAVEPQVGGVARTAMVVLSLPPDAGLRDGDAVELALEETVAERGFWAALSALTTGPRGLWAVHLVEDGPDGPVVARAVVEALRVDTERAYVRGPVAEGARMIVQGAHRVAPGQHVTPAPQSAAEG